MKLLYISSGYPRIYDYLDQSIKAELDNKHYEWTYFHPSEHVEKLKSIVATFQPQLALTLLGDHLSVQAIQYLKESGIRIACWMTEDPFYIDKAITIIRKSDYVFTVDVGALKHYRSIHPNVHHLPLGTNDAIFKPQLVNDIYKSDLLLVGYPYPTRVKLIQFLLEHTSYQITLVGKGWHNILQKKWRNNPKVIMKDTWIEPQEVACYYNEANIVLNPHRSHNFWYNQNTHGIVSESINNRTFDIAACEAFQLIEEKPDLRSFFTKDEMISYLDLEDCLDKVMIYMNDEEQRQTIAQKARKIVTKQHTFHHRIKEIIEIVQKNGL